MNDIKILVSKGRIEEAIAQLSADTVEDPYLQQLVLQLSSRYQQLKSGQWQGIVSAEDYSLEYNKISNSLLEIADQKPLIPKKRGNRPVVIGLSGAVLLVISGMFIWKPWAPAPGRTNTTISNGSVSPDTVAKVHTEVQPYTAKKDSDNIKTVEKPQHTGKAFSAHPSVQFLNDQLTIPAHFKEAIEGLYRQHSKPVKISVGYAPAIVVVDQEKKKYNYNGGNMVISINNQRIRIGEIPLKAWKSPVGNDLDEIEKHIYHDIEEALKQDRMIQIIVQKIRDHE